MDINENSDSKDNLGFDTDALTQTLTNFIGEFCFNLHKPQVDSIYTKLDEVRKKNSQIHDYSVKTPPVGRIHQPLSCNVGDGATKVNAT
jgi:hypothetical protein